MVAPHDSLIRHLKSCKSRSMGLTHKGMHYFCNGQQVPMHPSNIAGQAIAGIKYRAWQPPRCLHPTIGINVPLQFDIVDRATQFSMGGCRYFSADPSGRAHEAFPINANEAESRRAARFRSGTVTGGRFEIPPLAQPQPSNDYPITFDLRRFG